MASREETKKMIEVMQAYVDGAEIQGKGRGLSLSPMATIDEPFWDWGKNNYRVKPVVKPEIPWEMVDEKYNYFATDENGNSYFYEAPPPSQKNFNGCGSREVVRVRAP